MLLHDKDYKYGESTREMGGNITKDGFSKFFKIYKETQLLQNKTGKGRKRFIQNQLMIRELKD